MSLSSIPVRLLEKLKTSPPLYENLGSIQVLWPIFIAYGDTFR